MNEIALDKITKLDPGTYIVSIKYASNEDMVYFAEQMGIHQPEGVKLILVDERVDVRRKDEMCNRNYNLTIKNASITSYDASIDDLINKCSDV